MSGGVDSSAAAALLVDQGHEVTGVTLKLWGGPSDAGCCSVSDVEDARQVAAQLGIDHHVFNLGEEFDELVVAPYVEAHRRGVTPNPCIECNRHLKFDALLSTARRLGFERLATGHHARITPGPRGPELRRGVDRAKDQSYVLSMLTAEKLRSLLLPVGELTKVEVRDVARSIGLRTSEKPESQDTCFIESSGGRRRFLAERTELHDGDVIEESTGRVVGRVADLELITIGQRKRLGVDESGRRRVAVAIDVERRAVMVSTPEEAMITDLPIDVGSLTWVDDPMPAGAKVHAQMRSHGRVSSCRFEGDRLVFDPPVAPVAPGQTTALFCGEDADRVVGSFVVAA
jgi:tRNA-specific 2-thiouridylase